MEAAIARMIGAEEDGSKAGKRKRGTADPQREDVEEDEDEEEEEDEVEEEDEEEEDEEENELAQEAEAAAAAAAEKEAADAAAYAAKAELARREDDEARKAAQDDARKKRRLESEAKLSEEAREYLEMWKAKGDGGDGKSGAGGRPWKFKKKVQIWIVKHMYDAALVPKASFALALEYLDGMKGAARTDTYKEACAIMEEPPIAADGGKGPADDAKRRKADRVRRSRANAVARLLS